MKKYIIALDLHGTLLDLNWKIKPDLENDLKNVLTNLIPNVDFYICTGNNFSFVEKYVPKDIFDLINGFILETGCILNQTILTDHEIISKINILKDYLIKKQYPFIKFFADRKSSISIFTCDEYGGEPPERYLDTITNDLQTHEYQNDFYVTYSNVAIDIIPANFSKWNTLKTIKDNTSCEIISFMDSYNDKDVALYSDYTILPNNSSHELLNYLKQNNKNIIPLKDFAFSQKQAYFCDDKYTLAVINGLKKIMDLI